MWSIRKAAGSAAVFVQLADAVIADVRRGVLRAGDRLPSTRTLSRQLAVNRNTVVAAYDELLAQGWVVAEGPAGTRVAEDIPERHARRPGGPGAHVAPGMATKPAFELGPARPPAFTPAADPGAKYQLSAGVPDPRLAPTMELARAYRRALRGPAGREALSYGDPLGTTRLRVAVAELVRTSRGIPATAANVMITRGSQMGIELAARLLLGGRGRQRSVGVEAIGYPPAWRSFEQAGARLSGIALDDAGLVVDAIPRGVACIYTTPHHQYPTTVTLSPARRMALLERARRDGFAIIEDDYDYEFHYEGRPVAPLAATDRGQTVIYVGTLSKTLAPGLRLGFVVAAETVIAQLGRLRFAIDRQGDHVLETAVAALLEDGELQRHARKQRRVNADRRDALIGALARDLGSALAVTVPPGGITLWARVADDVPLDAWRQRCRALGVAFATAREFELAPRAGRALPFVRLAFARYSEAELADAVRRMRRALSSAA